MISNQDPDTVRVWTSVALSWTGTTAAFLLDNAGALAALVSIGYTLWQWRRQHLKDEAEHNAQRKLLRRLGIEPLTEPDELDTRPQA